MPLILSDEKSEYRGISHTSTATLPLILLIACKYECKTSTLRVNKLQTFLVLGTLIILILSNLVKFNPPTLIDNYICDPHLGHHMLGNTVFPSYVSLTSSQ